jgi:carboxylate/amino acid/amine transporter
MQYLILVSVIWGFSFIIIKGSLSSLDSSFVSFVRLFLSLIIFLPFLRPSGIKNREKLQLMLIGSIQFGIMYLAYITAFRDLPAHVIALLTTTTPLFVSIFSDLTTKEFHKTTLLAALLAVAGGAVLEFSGQSIAANVRGVVLVQISNAAFAFGQITYRKWMTSRTALRDKDVFGFLYAGAVVITGLFSLTTTSFNKISIQPHQWLALLYLGIIASGICFFLWNRGARRTSAGTLAIMNNMKIPVAVIASITILKEHSDWLKLLGGCVLFALALYINSFPRNKTSQQS